MEISPIGLDSQMESQSNPKLQDPSSNHSQTPNPKYKSQAANLKTGPTGDRALGFGIYVWALGVGTGWDLELGAWDLTRREPADRGPRLPVRQPVLSDRGHGGVPFGHQRPVAAPGVR